MASITPSSVVQLRSVACGLTAGVTLTLGVLIAGGASQPRVGAPTWAYTTYIDSTIGQPILVQGDRRIVGADEVGAALQVDLRRRAPSQGVVLDALGAAGWELVSVEREEENRTSRFRLKRPL